MGWMRFAKGGGGEGSKGEDGAPCGREWREGLLDV